MTNANQARYLHHLLDLLVDKQDIGVHNIEKLRAELPKLPKQKTLGEISAHVYDAWAGTSGNEWPDDVHGDLETWLDELHAQLARIKSEAAPGLPSGMRLADHEVYGRCVVSPTTDDDGARRIFCLSSPTAEWARNHWVPFDSLTFVDAEPTHPEFLETEADYAAAPEGTIVACDESSPWHRFDSVWLSSAVYESNSSKDMTGVIRRVLRWGWDK